MKDQDSRTLRTGSVPHTATLLLLSLGFGQAHGQDNSPSGGTAERDKMLRIARTETAPTIDGVLDDLPWTHAPVIEDLHQFDPVDHGEPTEHTEVYVLYDDDNLYVAARMFDSEPDQIRARQMVQGQAMWFDDSFTVLLDPFNNKRTGYSFQVNPVGNRRDGIYETPTEQNQDWEGIWHAVARINDEGWAAEFSIPFKTLNFDPNNADWGFTVERSIARKQEDIAWVSFNRDINPGATGVITGLTGLQQGVGLDIVPSVVTSHSRDFETHGTDSETDPSLDAFYNFTPSLTGVLTLNTDFSATEVDDRQINLTRFSLFFPEKRDFFLQDVDIFSFGGLERNGIPFHSRRIGLGDKGRPVDLEVGAKVTGRVGRWNVGVLDIQQEGFNDVDDSNLFVGRISANVLEESSVGMILTNGDPRTNLGNSLVGTDFRYRNTRLPGDRTLEGELWFQQSDTEGIDGEDTAWGLRIASPNSEGLRGELAYDTFSENFNPALGFVNRFGIARTELAAGYTYRPTSHRWLRSIQAGFNFENFDKISGGLESRRIFLELLEAETHSGDDFSLNVARDREVLLEAFEIADGVVIPRGDYQFDSIGIELGGAQERSLAPEFDLDVGDFYNGEILSAAASLDWRPNEHLFLGLGYEYNDVYLPEGEFVTRLIQVEANYAFDVRWSWVNLIQYDNESYSVGINSRLRWNPRAGRDLYIVANHGFDANGAFSRLRSTDSSLSIKYTQTFRL